MKTASRGSAYMSGGRDKGAGEEEGGGDTTTRGRRIFGRFSNVKRGVHVVTTVLLLLVVVVEGGRDGLGAGVERKSMRTSVL